MIPKAMQPVRSRYPTSRVRAFQIGLWVSRSLSLASRARQCVDDGFDLVDAVVGHVGGQPARPDEGVIHARPVMCSNRSRIISRSWKPSEHRGDRTQFHSARGHATRCEGDPG